LFLLNYWLGHFSFHRRRHDATILHVRHRQTPTTGEADLAEHVSSRLHVLHVSSRIILFARDRSIDFPQTKLRINHIKRKPSPVLPRNDPDCKKLLQPVLNHCDSATCARNECMEALQHFYTHPDNHKHSVEIAFCLCRSVRRKWKLDRQIRFCRYHGTARFIALSPATAFPFPSVFLSPSLPLLSLELISLFFPYISFSFENRICAPSFWTTRVPRLSLSRQ